MTPILTGIIASGISGHLTPPWSPEGAYDALATVIVPSGGAASVTFSGIPTGYKHLEIRGIARDNRATSGQDLGTIRFNGDSATNYARHRLYGNGSGTASADGGATQSSIFGFNAVHANGISNTFGTGIMTILDYTDTSKHKTIRCLTGDEQNGSGYLFFNSGVWLNTSAINSITLLPDSASTGYLQYSSFALYGVK
jgi:hypothetical protein